MILVRVVARRRGTTTLVRVRVLDDADREVLNAEGPVRWSDDSCHPTPDVTKI
jgi:ribosomal protein S28E/S33